MKFAGTFAIPTWAVNAIKYWDFSGLDDLDTELVQSFIDANFKHGFVVNWRGIDEPYTTTCPDIGSLLTEVVDADFYHA